MSSVSILRLVAVLLLTLLAVPAGGAWGQTTGTTPSVTTSFESHFEAPQPLPIEPLDHIFQIVNLEPGAATPYHYHLGPGFATILQGEVTHHRFALGQDAIYGPGQTWVELPDDVHFARDATVTPATILATFLLPQDASPSYATEDQPSPAPAAPTVPVLVRSPISTAAAGYGVTQLMRTYEPASSTTSSLGSGEQAIVIVVSGQLTAQEDAEPRTLGPGEYWVEHGERPVTSSNLTTSTASAVVSILTPQPAEGTFQT